MKRISKIGLFGMALAALVNMPVCAEEEEGVVGWTPIAFGIATPVQLPWGINRWDVFGLDLNLLYSDAPLMYGIDIGGLAARTRDELRGIEVSGLWNFNQADVYGVRATIGANMCPRTIYGLDLGMVGYNNEIYGAEVSFLCTVQRSLTGFGMSLLANITENESCGLAVAGGGNIAAKASGLHMGLIFNYTDELRGCQIALVNFARECPGGFQIGLVNIIMDNQLKLLPIVNGFY